MEYEVRQNNRAITVNGRPRLPISGAIFDLAVRDLRLAYFDYRCRHLVCRFRCVIFDLAVLDYCSVTAVSFVVD